MYLNKMSQYKTVQVSEFSLEGLLPCQEPIVDYTNEQEQQLDSTLFIEGLSNQKQKIVTMLMDGYSYHAIAKNMGMKIDRIYQIRDDLQQILLQNDPALYAEYRKKNGIVIDLLAQFVAQNVRNLPLADFVMQYINQYDNEAVAKGWKRVDFQNTLENIWENNPKSCTLAPREHLKTTSLLEYLVKKLFIRTYPIEINYYHLTGDIANEKFNKLKRYLQGNELFNEVFGVKEAKSWADNYIELKDGTIIRPMSWKQGVVGKHPHIIILDDIIDRTVMYSDAMNTKSIDKFYSDIYPMISRADKDKKIIIIGTAQRKDDIYHSLPSDFVLNIFKAIDHNNNDKILCPEMYTRASLNKIKADMSRLHGEKYWLKEYMNEPFEAMGFIVKKDQIQYYTEAPFGLEIYQGWDLSVGRDIEKGDWTVCVTIGLDRSGDKIKIYILNVFRARINFNERLRGVINLGEQFKPEAIGIEDVAFQYDMIKLLRDKTLFTIIGVKPINNKVERFQAELAPYFENMQVYIKRDMVDYEMELLSLPVGQYDDQGDATLIALKAALYGAVPDELIAFV